MSLPDPPIGAIEAESGLNDTPSDTAFLLAGKRVVVTRAAAQSRELVDLLHARGAEVIELPLIEIVWWVNKELVFHAGEIWLMRDLYAVRPG